MVPAGVDITNPTPPGNFSLQGPTILTTTTLSGTPTTQETVTTGSSFIRNTLQGFGLSQSASTLIQALGCNMTPFSEDGRDFVLKGKYIPCLPLWCHLHLFTPTYNKNNERDISCSSPQTSLEFIWDTELVLNFLKNLNPSEITVKLLTLKTVTLLTLLSGQRVSTIHQFQ